MEYEELFDQSLASNESEVSSSEEPLWITTPIQIAGIVMYTLLCIVTLVIYIIKRTKSSVPLQQMASLFYIGLPIFSILRVIWFILEMNQSSEAGLASNLLNRVSFCVFLFVFNALLFYWIDTVHTTVNVAFAKEAFKGSLDYEFITPAGRIGFWIATATVILLTLVLAIVRAVLIGTADKTASDYKTMKDTINTVYDVNNIIIGLTFLAYGLCFFIYGTTLSCRIKKNQGSSNCCDIVKAETFAVVLTLCFAVRCVMFSYRVMTGKYLDNDLYISLSYFVPELLTSAMCLWSVNVKMFSESPTPGAKEDDDDDDDDEKDDCVIEGEDV